MNADARLGLRPSPGSDPVVVVGAGPVGLLVAGELALRRVPVVVLERLHEVVDQPKAGTLHARPAQLLRRRGYLAPGPLGAPAGALARASFHFAAQFGLDVSSPAAEGAPIVSQWQGELERFLDAVCRSRGVDLRRGVEVEHVHQDPGGATVGYRDAAGSPRSVRASWVVGADGGRGIVRAAARIGTDDTPPSVRSLIGRVRLGSVAHDLAGWQETPRGWTLVNLVPGGLSRLITFEFGADHDDRQAPVALDELRAVAERVTGRAVPMDRLEWSGRFTDFGRLARAYRAGRLLLAGDAAHLHFPVGGQGLGLGIQDAFALGWRLALVARGEAPEQVLDDYERERRPHAARALAYTREQAEAMDPRPERAVRRSALLAAASLPGRRRELGRQVSSQDLRTTHGADDPAAVGTFLTDRALRAGGEPTRLSALLASGKALLLEPGRDPEVRVLARAWATRLEHVPGCGPSIVDGEPADAVLVRPDGYVGWVGPTHDLAPLSAALEQWLGTPASGVAEEIGARSTTVTTGSDDRRPSGSGGVRQRTVTALVSTTPSA
ncbi:MAG: FAD-dependent monooxygenase [Patulibacter minatonensis]